MILDEQGMQRARELASELVRVDKDKQIKRYRAEREKRVRSTRESFESFGRVFRNVQNAYIEGIYKPLNNARKAISRGFHS